MKVIKILLSFALLSSLLGCKKYNDEEIIIDGYVLEPFFLFPHKGETIHLSNNANAYSLFEEQMRLDVKTDENGYYKFVIKKKEWKEILINYETSYERQLSSEISRQRVDFYKLSLHSLYIKFIDDPNPSVDTIYYFSIKYPCFKENMNNIFEVYPDSLERYTTQYFWVDVKYMKYGTRINMDRSAIVENSLFEFDEISHDETFFSTKFPYYFSEMTREQYFEYGETNKEFLEEKHKYFFYPKHNINDGTISDTIYFYY